MTYYPDLETIDWANIHPVKNNEYEPPVTIPPLGRWWYAFETTGSYLGGHIYKKFNMKAVPCGKSAISKDGGSGADMVGDHPVVEPCPDFDGDSLCDDWEFVFELSSEDDGGVNPDNGPAGDPDGDGIVNSREQTLLTSPLDPEDPPTIAPGYDFLRVAASVIRPLGMPPTPPMPADFFGPGSDPFTGQVTLGG